MKELCLNSSLSADADLVSDKAKKDRIKRDRIKNGCIKSSRVKSG